MPDSKHVDIAPSMLQNRLFMPQSVLEFRVAAVLYGVQTFHSSKLGHV